MENVRCSACQALLFKAAPTAFRETIEIKCRRCRAINIFRAGEPDQSERRDRPDK